MKVEILTRNGIENAFQELGIEASKTYSATEKPKYNVYEIEKKDISTLENAEWDIRWGSWFYPKRSNNGTPFDFLTVNNQFIIGWGSDDGCDTYDSLIDYLRKGKSAHDDYEIAAMAYDLAKTNGMTLAKLFNVFQG